MDGIVLAQPAVKLIEKLSTLRLGDLRIGRALDDGPERLEASETRPGKFRRRTWDLGFWILDFGLWTLDFGLWTFGLWTLDLSIGFRQSDDGHLCLQQVLLERLPVDIERIRRGDQFRVALRVLGESVRFTENKDRVFGQIIEQRAQLPFRFAGSALLLPLLPPREERGKSCFHQTLQNPQLAAWWNGDFFEAFLGDLRNGIEVTQRLQFV